MMSNDEAVIAEAVAYPRSLGDTYVIFADEHADGVSAHHWHCEAGISDFGIYSVYQYLSQLCFDLWAFRCAGAGDSRRGNRNADFTYCGTAHCHLVSVETGSIPWRLNVRKLVHIDTSYMQDYIRVSLPVLITQALWGFSSIVQTAILGKYGEFSAGFASKLDFGPGLPGFYRLWDMVPPVLLRF